MEREKMKREETFFTSLIDKETFWIVLGVFILCAAVVGGSAWYNYTVMVVNKTAIEQGYSRQTVPGEEGTHWVKNGAKLEDAMQPEKKE